MFDKNKKIPFNKEYLEKASLVLEILPIVNEFDMFALHGGTAINFFLFDDLYRLSTDIDLKYLIHEGHEKAKSNIFYHLRRIKETLVAKGYQVHREEGRLRSYVKKNDIEIFIDTSIDSREAIGEVISQPINKVIAREFHVEPFEVRLIPDWQIMGSKLLTCLARQHARDAFDSYVFLSKDQITEKIKEGIFKNLILSNASIFNILNPLRKIWEEKVKTQFIGMSRFYFDYNLCVESIRYTAQRIHQSLNDLDKKFLVSIENQTVDRDTYNWLNSPAIKEAFERKYSQKSSITKRLQNLDFYFTNGPNRFEI
ncbi:MAG: nucleotidyl transferase AbiEii/AbiGii toxin family protein [Flavobacteriaceae bacterium]|nr:nucleotidyl transferase AbiEii/AbiGii toxin family protein [Flavobacteriaceae bacterium]